MAVDFTKTTKNFLTIKLKDERTIFVCPPKKRVSNQIEIFTEMSANKTAKTDDVYKIMSEILSNNKQNEQITVKELEEYDTEDIKTVFKAFAEFIKGETQSPN